MLGGRSEIGELTIGLEAFAKSDQAGPQRITLGAESALVLLVFISSRRSFNGNGFITEEAQIVGARLHINFSDFTGEGEAVGNQIRRAKRG